MDNVDFVQFVMKVNDLPLSFTFVLPSNAPTSFTIGVNWTPANSKLSLFKLVHKFMCEELCTCSLTT